MNSKLAVIFFLTASCIVFLGAISERQTTFCMQMATVCALLCIAMAIMATKEKQ